MLSNRWNRGKETKSSNVSLRNLLYGQLLQSISETLNIPLPEKSLNFVWRKPGQTNEEIQRGINLDDVEVSIFEWEGNNVECPGPIEELKGIDGYIEEPPLEVEEKKDELEKVGIEINGLVNSLQIEDGLSLKRIEMEIEKPDPKLEDPPVKRSDELIHLMGRGR